MKTNKDWFETLEEPYRTQALENTIRIFNEESLSDSLLRSFNWKNSPERHHYWETLHNKLENENN